MAAPALRARIFRGIAAVSIATTLLTSATVFFAYEDMERSMLHLIFADEEAFFLSHLDSLGHHIDTATLHAAFVPAGSGETVPALFGGLAAPYSGELHHQDKTYLIRIDRVQGGTLYLAKDVSLFERREALFRGVLAAVFVLSLGIGMLLAGITARGIARPLSRLASAIDRLSTEKSAAAPGDFPCDFREKELQGIALAFAGYLDEAAAHSRRERRLLGLASHELRTPVAVISGALDVVEKPGGIDDPRRQRALKRIRVAADEMREQLAAILSLSRKADPDEPRPTDLGAIVDAVIDDLAAAGFPVERLSWEAPSAPVIVPADAVLAKMLVRNVLHNALQHSATEQVVVRLEEEALSISDSGPGLPAAYRGLLEGGPGQAPEGVIGLYLVTLIAERLGWSLTTGETPGGGTRIALSWKSAAAGGLARTFPGQATSATGCSLP